MGNMRLTSEILNKIFKDPSIQYGLKEFDNIRPDQVLKIFEKPASAPADAKAMAGKKAVEGEGKREFYIKRMK